MILEFSSDWRVAALRGALALAAGLLLLFWPAISLTVFVTIFGAYLLVDGIFLVARSAVRRQEGRALMLVRGLVGAALGLVTIFWPGITGLVLLYLIAAWAVLSGIVEIVSAIRLRREINGEGLLILVGVVSVAMGVALALWPLPGALAVAWLVGLFAAVFGVSLLIRAFRLRGLTNGSAR
jgi:uncharacterized membrane protein HdeD (DUF308 family)